MLKLWWSDTDSIVSETKAQLLYRLISITILSDAAFFEGNVEQLVHAAVVFSFIMEY